MFKNAISHHTASAGVSTAGRNRIGYRMSKRNAFLMRHGGWDKVVTVGASLSYPSKMCAWCQSRVGVRGGRGLRMWTKASERSGARTGSEL